MLDPYQYYVEVIPMSLDLPYVHVSNALYFDYSGYTPLCINDWPHESTPAASGGSEPFRKLPKLISKYRSEEFSVIANFPEQTTQVLDEEATKLGRNQVQEN